MSSGMRQRKPAALVPDAQANLLSKFRRLDVYPKLEDNYRVKTQTGATGTSNMKERMLLRPLEPLATCVARARVDAPLEPRVCSPECVACAAGQTAYDSSFCRVQVPHPSNPASLFCRGGGSICCREYAWPRRWFAPRQARCADVLF